MKFTSENSLIHDCLITTFYQSLSTLIIILRFKNNKKIWKNNVIGLCNQGLTFFCIKCIHYFCKCNKFSFQEMTVVSEMTGCVTWMRWDETAAYLLDNETRWVQWTGLSDTLGPLNYRMLHTSVLPHCLANTHHLLASRLCPFIVLALAHQLIKRSGGWEDCVVLTSPLK